MSFIVGPNCLSFCVYPFWPYISYIRSIMLSVTLGIECLLLWGQTVCLSGSIHFGLKSVFIIRL